MTIGRKTEVTLVALLELLLLVLLAAEAKAVRPRPRKRFTIVNIVAEE